MEIKNGQDLKKEVLEELKKEGLDYAEETVVSLIKVAFRILPKFGGLITNPTGKLVYGLVVGPVVAMQPKVLEWADKIDGEDDPGR